MAVPFVRSAPMLFRFCLFFLFAALLLHAGSARAHAASDGRGRRAMRVTCDSASFCANGADLGHPRPEAIRQRERCSEGLDRLSKGASGGRKG